MLSITTEVIGRQYGASRGRRRYKVTGTDDESAALSAILDGGTPLAPATWGSLSRIDYSALESARKVWEIDIDYGTRSFEALDGVTEWSYSTDGGKENQKFVETGQASIVYPGTGPDLAGAIGVNSDGTIDGVDRITGLWAAEARTRLTSAAVDAAYITTLLDMTGTINDAQFSVFEEGECLFTGARLNQVNATQWDAVFTFLGSKNPGAITIGSITDIEKEGWQYLWVYSKPKIYGTDPKVVGAEPVAAYVESIYKKKDFDLLSIPT